MKSAFTALALALGCSFAMAQAQGTSSPAKKELAQKLLAQQQGDVEALARNLVASPIDPLLADAQQAMARVPADKRDQVTSQIQDEIKRYFDETTPIVRDRAIKLSQETMGPAIEEKFTEDELRQIVAFYDSPAYKKYRQVMPEASNGLAQRIVADTRGNVEPRIRTLQTNVGKLLGITPAAGAGGNGGASSPKTPAPRASAAPSRAASRP
ncbi:MAG TPA: DUF2059 domain-containing protein [Burkholderiaceae bacterium]|jgi:hypothetical protein|nr:DUF2059 domain-containing protein [Burkholderiaceae bacterium]